jgi:hypothetical protein
MSQLSELDKMGIQVYLNSVIDDGCYTLPAKSKFRFIVTSHKTNLFRGTQDISKDRQGRAIV